MRGGQFLLVGVGGVEDEREGPGIVAHQLVGNTGEDFAYEEEGFGAGDEDMAEEGDVGDMVEAGKRGRGLCDGEEVKTSVEGGGGRWGGGECEEESAGERGVFCWEKVMDGGNEDFLFVKVEDSAEG